MNLIQSGAHEVADTLLVKMRASKEHHSLWVSPIGMVTMASLRKSWRRGSPPPDSDLVGTYTGTAKCKDIRDDLAERMREIGR
jgi:hypothetical protein